MRGCFSYAAYAKNLIDHLKSSCNIPVQEGLSELEFSHIELSLNFTFPPDLRSILREGLPVGPGFPNWRSSSHQQLHLLISLPVLGICKEVGCGGFWLRSWGERPQDSREAVELAREELGKAPVLIPIYRSFFIPSLPKLAGNPVFSVVGSEVKLSSFDVSGFFQQRVEEECWDLRMSTPAWAAKSARRIKVWTEMVEVARGNTRGWWCGGAGRLGECLEEVFWRLRDAGWKEEEVREMMEMDGGDSSHNEAAASEQGGVKGRDQEDVVLHVRVLSLLLLRGGWSIEDVIYSLGLKDEYGILLKQDDYLLESSQKQL